MVSVIAGFVTATNAPFTFVDSASNVTMGYHGAAGNHWPYGGNRRPHSVDCQQRRCSYRGQRHPVHRIERFLVANNMTFYNWCANHHGGHEPGQCDFGRQSQAVCQWHHHRARRDQFADDTGFVQRRTQPRAYSPMCCGLATSTRYSRLAFSARFPGWNSSMRPAVHGGRPDPGRSGGCRHGAESGGVGRYCQSGVPRVIRCS